MMPEVRSGPWSLEAAVPGIAAADVGLEQGGAAAEGAGGRRRPERAPWILYIQPDTIVDDIAFTFPFEMYQGKDWVSVGTSESVLQGWASGAC